MRIRIPALCAIGIIAFAAPGVANADTRDDDFVNNLAGQGITGDPAKLISTAHMVCTAGTQAGAAVPAGLGRMLPVGYVLTTLRLSYGQDLQFVDAARGAYCPDPAAPDAVPALAGVPSVPGMPPVPAMDRVTSALGGLN